MADQDTNWAQLRQAYGPADNIPALLDRMMADQSDPVWDELFSCLFHQGTVYSAKKELNVT